MARRSAQPRVVRGSQLGGSRVARGAGFV